MALQTVSSRPDFVKNEQKILRWWYRAGIVEKYLQKNARARKKFRFLDGPITANNPMGVHHAHGRTVKDFFQRYKNLLGFKQRFQNGFDSQGLWVEVEVERDLGLNSKREIEAFGLERFSRACRKRVEKFAAIQTQQSQRLGMFMDWGNDYYTMSDINNEHIWHFLKVCYEKGLIYKGKDVMPWCSRCGTALSQHELSDGGYKTLSHDTVVVKFPVQDARRFGVGQENVFLLVWTTTPWTLPANTALAVNPTAPYVVVEKNGEALVLAEDRLANVLLDQNFKILKKLQGRDLVGLHYQPVYNFVHPATVENAFIVVPAEFVVVNEGTGIVHIAPGAGKDDFQLSQEKNLAVVAPLDEFGRYLPSMGRLAGKNVVDVNRQIPLELAEKGLLYRQDVIKHSYPVCWRCKEEVVFRLTSEWFIKMSPLREGLKEAAKQVDWIPDFAGKRMQDWLKLMGDWPISRRRYWGLALPIFEDEERSEFYVVGSRQELEELALEPKKVRELPELHRPWIDGVLIKSPQTGKTLRRVKAVGDAWLDAGIVAFSTLNYLNDRQYWRQWYPFDFAAEYIPQVRLWFYSSLVMSYVLAGRAPWKTVFAGGFVVDEKGEPMHKSAGNAIEFNEAAQRVGADAMRWLYLREKVANYYGAGNLRFGYRILAEVQRRFFMILWNSYRFFVTNANLDGWSVPAKAQPDKAVFRQNILDVWILSRLNNLIRLTTRSLNKFNTPDAASAIENFVVADLSQWYVRRSRERVGPTASDNQDKQAFYFTSNYVWQKLLVLLAPFIPFLSEEIYQNLRLETMPESIHLLDWPKVELSLIAPKVERQMELVREIVEKGHAIRKKKGLRVRQPLAKLGVVNLPFELTESVVKIIQDELNVKEMNSRVGSGELQVKLETKITPGLRREGYAREIIRAVQNLRRQANYKFDAQIILLYKTQSRELARVMQEFAPVIQQKLLAKRVEFAGELKPADALGRIELHGQTIQLATRRLIT